MRYAQQSIIVFLSCFLFFLTLFFSHRQVYAGRFGLNVGGLYSDFNKALNYVGENGWIVILHKPDDELASYISLAQKANVHLVIRGHVPNIPLTKEYAQKWARFFARNDIDFAYKVYFMPVNEPNNSQENITIKEAREYIDNLMKEFDKYGIRKSRAVLLSPSLDMYQLADKGLGVYEELGGASFFKQFDGITLHLYGEMTRDNKINSSSHEYKKGNWRKIINDLGLSETSQPIYILETGVVCIDCDSPDYRGSKTKYPFTKQYAQMMATYMQYVLQNESWIDSRVAMFSPFTYSPEQFSRGSWLRNDESINNLIAVMRGFGAGNAQLEYVNNNALSSSTAGDNKGTVGSKRTIIGKNTDSFLEGALIDRPYAVIQSDDCSDNGSDECKLIKGSSFTNQSELPESVAGYSEKDKQEEKGILKKITSKVTGFFGSIIGFIFKKSSEQKGYAQSFTPYALKADGRGAGEGDLLSQKEVENIHANLRKQLLPYVLSNDLSSSVPLDRFSNQPSEYDNQDNTEVEGTESPDNIDSLSNAGKYADFILQTAGKNCGWQKVGKDIKFTKSIQKNNVSCLNRKIAAIAYYLIRASAYKRGHDYKLQCVGFVRAAEFATGGRLEGRNAKNYCKYSKPQGYRRYKYNLSENVSQVKEGDFIVWTRGLYGHIALVESVDTVNNMVFLREANYASSGSIGMRPDDPAVSGAACILRRS